MALYNAHKKQCPKTGSMARLVKMLSAKLEDMSSIPGIHTVKGKNQLIQVAL